VVPLTALVSVQVPGLFQPATEGTTAGKLVTATLIRGSVARRTLNPASLRDMSVKVNTFPEVVATAATLTGVCGGTWNICSRIMSFSS
jgi:hypothetical protein